MELFHSTKAVEKILKEGFKIPDFDINTVGRFGAGVYLGTTVEKACEFGVLDSIVVAKVNDNQILKFDYCQLLDWFPERELSIEDCEGVIELREFVLSQGYLGCHICYSDNDEEVVIYDTSIISDLKKYKKGL